MYSRERFSLGSAEDCCATVTWYAFELRNENPVIADSSIEEQAMRKVTRFLALPWLTMVLAGILLASGTHPSTESRRVRDLLNKMTLEEKIGQMTQVSIEVVSRGEGGRAEPHEIDPAKLEEALLKYHVGSILNVANSAYSLEHWHEIITKIQDVATKKTRLGIPVLYGIDAVHGVNYTLGATIFPQHIAMAATWNRELVRREGEITAREMRASGIPWNFSPVLDIGRHPAWPRLFETFGEDVYLASVMAREYVVGLQGDNIAGRDKVAACLKHYVGYSTPLTGKDRTQALIPEMTLREYFLPPFQAGLEAGAPSVMVNSSEVNGIPGHANSFLLKNVLRDEFKFTGLVVSDWEDVKRLHTCDRVADSPKEAVRLAVMSGIDMSMVPLDFSFYDLLLELAREGSVPMSRIDEAVGRILTLKSMLGLFENPYPDESLKTKFGSRESEQANLQAARECITLLQNKDQILPLSKTTRVLVTGPTASMLSVMNSGWTITWQGDIEALYPKEKPTILQAIKDKVGEGNVTYIPGATVDSVVNIQAAVDALKSHDVAVVCLGERAYCESPGNIDDLTLDEAQLALASALMKTGKPVILVLIEGRPRIIERIADGARGIIMGYLPGMEGGKALADVLFGDFNPCGRLPFTYPRHPNDLMTYDHKPLDIADTNRFHPQFPFGFGLSYTSFHYSNLEVQPIVSNPRPKFNISVKVRNAGSIAGKEVVQVYLTDLYGTISRPVKQLKRFEKVLLRPGEERKMEFSLEWNDLSFIGKENKRIVEPGRFRVTVANLTEEFELK